MDPELRPPKNLRVKEKESDCIWVMWDEPDDEDLPITYRIWFKKDGEEWRYNNILTATECRCTKLESNTWYTFRVYSFHNGKLSTTYVEIREKTDKSFLGKVVPFAVGAGAAAVALALTGGVGLAAFGPAAAAVGTGTGGALVLGMGSGAAISATVVAGASAGNAAYNSTSELINGKEDKDDKKEK